MDLKTIIICLVVVNLFMGFFTLIIKRTQPTFPGINFWIYSSFLIAAGYFLLVLRNHVSDFMSVTLSHVAFITGGFIRIAGLKRFFFIREKRLFTSVLLAIFFIYIIPDIFFTFFKDNELIRTLLLGTVLSGISLYIGVLILQNKPSHKYQAYYFSAISYFVFSGIFLIRIIYWLFEPNVRGMFNPVLINNIQFLSSIIIDIVWTTMFFVMHNQRINDQLRQSEDSLITANKEKDKFLSILSHDLKNVFNSIYNLSELILLKFKSASRDETQHHINILFATTEKAYNLLEDLLYWSESHNGNIRFNPERIEIADLFQKVKDKLSMSNSKNITVNYDPGHEPVLLYADKNMMQSVLRNLINNAFKYTNEGGRIDVTARKQDKSAEISVRDTGVGISDEFQARLWDITGSISTPGTGNEKGTGFGLLLCRELIEKHGGKIWVESTPGEGSTFSFSIPLFGESALNS